MTDGQNLMTAHREYMRRTDDERFDSLDDLVASAREDRRLSVERAYNLRDLAVTPHNDTLALQSPKGIARFSHWSFSQTCRMLGAPAGYVGKLPPAIAADCLNHGISEAPTGTVANLLVRAPNGTPYPVVRACTSDSYGRAWDDELIGAVNDQIVKPSGGTFRLPLDWDHKVAGAYRGDRDSFVCLVNGGSIVEDPSARSFSGSGSDERAMYRGILMRNSEVGAASVSIDTVMFRFICGNLIIWGAIYDRRFRRRHVGTRVTRDAVRQISRIAADWTNQSASRDEAMIRTLIDLELASTREAVIDELRAIGITKDQAERAYDATEQHESASPRSFWGLSQGLTRISQESGYQDARYALDQAAAKLLARGARIAA